MSKPIMISTAILAQNRRGSYDLDLLQDDGVTDHLFRFELTREAFEQLKADANAPPAPFSTSLLMPEDKGAL